MKNKNKELQKITKLNDLKGKTIVDLKYYINDLYIKFSNNSYAIFVVKDITVGFNYQKHEVNLNQDEIDKTESILVELGLISKKEYNEACELEEIEMKNRKLKQQELEQKNIEKQELEQLDKLLKKYKKL